MYKNVIRMGQANQGRKANTFSEIDTLADDSAFFVLQKIGGVRKARQLTKEAFALQFGEIFNHPIEIEYDDLLALANNNNLKLGVKYLITNATAASINLEVEAIATNQIHCDAKDPLYPNDKIMYNFASNVITWRWDTVRDVSAGEDWRNSNNLQIPESCTRITIGSGCIVTLGENGQYIEIGNDVSNDGILPTVIGANCKYIKIGNASRVSNIFAGSESIEIAEECSFNGLGLGQNIKFIGKGCSLEIPLTKSAIGVFLFSSSISSVIDSISNLTAYASSLDASAATSLYSITQQKTIQSGNGGAARLIYLDNTNTLVNVDAEV